MENSLSVAIPVYNAERYLRDAIQSVIDQGHPRLEIIVIDDGSTDGSRVVAESFGNVQYFQQENRGIAAARNAGVEQAQGELLAFLDADDLWTDQKLHWQLAALQQHPEAHIVAGGIEQFYESDRPRLMQDNPAGDAYTAGAMLIRHADFLRVGKFDERLRVGEFIDWHSRARSLGLREICLPDIVLRRRIHNTNTTLKQQHTRDDYVSVIRAHLHRQRRAA